MTAGLTVVRDSNTPGAHLWEVHLAGGKYPRSQGRLPVLLRRGPVDRVDGLVDLAHDDIDEAVEDRFLVGHVVVEGHRLDAEPPGEAAHGQCGEPAVVGDRDRGA
jgi:hypothetical protein